MVATGNVFKTKKVKIELFEMLNSYPSKIKAWLIMIELYCLLVDITSHHDRVKHMAARREEDALTRQHLFCTGQHEAFTTTDWYYLEYTLEIVIVNIDKDLRL